MSGSPLLPWPAQVMRTIGDAGADGPPHPGRFPAASAEVGDASELLARFTAACEQVGGTVHHLEHPAEIAALIGRVSQEDGADVTPALLSWAPDTLPAPDVVAICSALGMQNLDAQVRIDPAGQHDDLARLDAATVGLTGAVALLADTGSLIVTSGPGRPRLASLLPPVHVALVTRSQLVPSLAAFVATHPNAARDTTNLVVITGPSRTADIEMTLTRGVHGPRAVHVVFVA